MMRHSLTALMLGLILLAALPAQAQQFEQVGDYQIHYSAVNTSFLPEAVAREHGIQRSQAMALLNVSVMERLEDGSTRPVIASVEGRSGTLDGSEGRPLAFRSLRINDTPSQVAVFRIREDEPMRFDLRVRYDRNAEPAEVSFIQRFYIDR
ncbi:DUF4426 domain-containing protein [Halomonas saccharevitans]|uniref:DUF4426 domain-containing protein n=1 Tax=Halomonas saccharevitans TaxID=416872 RepID=A0A1I7CMW3_9GAMM|nr:DUF4426 domain-containing protein [Halomonas saccharevitans]MDT8878909.1 DUF4426 domain-containing protein [Halomonas saccharevitans]SFU00762.1 protein of unknown function [Halomonas saccharevitans]